MTSSTEVRCDLSDRVPEVFVRVSDREAEPAAVPARGIVRQLSGTALCVAADSFTDGMADLLGRVFGKREYVMLSDADSARRAAGDRLVRVIGSRQRGAVAISVDRSLDAYRAWIFPDGGMAHAYRVPDGYARTLFLTFVKLFWDDAEDEYAGGGERTEPARFGPVPNLPDALCLTPAGDLLDGEGGVTAYAGGKGFAESLASYPEVDGIVLCPGSSGAAARLSGGQVPLSYSDGANGGFSYLSGEGGGIVLPADPGGGDVCWSCRLSGEDAERFKAGYAADWRYDGRSKVSDLVGREVLFADRMEPVRVAETAEDGAVHHCASAEEYLSGREKRLGPGDIVPDHLSLAPHMTYRVAMEPPELPEGAELSRRYGEWNACRKAWEDSVDGSVSRFEDRYARLEADVGEKAHDADVWLRRLRKEAKEIREGSEDLLGLPDRELRRLDRRRKRLFRASNRFVRLCNQIKFDSGIARRKDEEMRGGTNTVGASARRGARVFSRVFTDRTQDMLGIVVDSYHVKRIRFPKGARPSGGRELYEKDGRLYLAVPGKDPRAELSDPAAVAEAKALGAELCVRR